MGGKLRGTANLLAPSPLSRPAIRAGGDRSRRRPPPYTEQPQRRVRSGGTYAGDLGDRAGGGHRLQADPAGSNIRQGPEPGDTSHTSVMAVLLPLGLGLIDPRAQPPDLAESRLPGAVCRRSSLRRWPSPSRGTAPPSSRPANSSTRLRSGVGGTANLLAPSPLSR